MRRAACALVLAGCASTYLSRAPRSPREPWPLPPESPRAIPTQPGATIEPDHVYSLPELIDIAESANPDTRIGWEKARQAALAVGIAKAEYFPTVSALAIGGYQHLWFPVPNIQAAIGAAPSDFLPNVSFPLPQLPSGRVGIELFQFLPFLLVRWTVLQFGRGASVRAAENLSVVANALFTADHQRIIFEVARAYFRSSAARAQVAVSRDALERTRAIAKAAEARFAHGIATTVELAEVRREVAQAEYNLTQAQSIEVSVYAALVSSLGIDPLVHLQVATTPSRDLPSRVETKVDEYVQSGLATRPDLKAAYARLPSTEAQISRSRAAYLPRLTLVGTGGTQLLGSQIDGGDTHTLNVPIVTAFLNFEWMIFDGGLRDIQTEIARSQNHQAQQELVRIVHQAVQEVITAYNELNASLSRYQAATALLSTATVADEAIEKAYVNGLSTLTDTMNAQKARSLATAAKEQAFADALIAAASLQFAAGKLTSAKVVDH
jgi:outer membrane protein